MERTSIERVLFATEDRAVVIRSTALPGNVVTALISEYRASRYGDSGAPGRLRLRTPFAIDSSWDSVIADVRPTASGGTAVTVTCRMRPPIARSTSCGCSRP